MVLTASIATAVLSLSSMAVSFGAGKKLLLGVAHGAADSAMQITISGKAVASIFLVVLPARGVFFRGPAGAFPSSRKVSRKPRAIFPRS